MRSMFLAAACVSLLACTVEAPDTSVTNQALITHNRLASNRLASNRLASNRLASNRLASNSLSTLALNANPETSDILQTPDGRDVYSYVVSCALPDGTTISADIARCTRHGAAEYELHVHWWTPARSIGAIGLAPHWADHKLDNKGAGTQGSTKEPLPPCSPQALGCSGSGTRNRTSRRQARSGRGSRRPTAAGARGLTPYEPGKPVEEVQRELGLERVVKLASNEGPFGPFPRALEAIERVARGAEPLSRRRRLPPAHRTRRAARRRVRGGRGRRRRRRRRSTASRRRRSTPATRSSAAGRRSRAT